MSDNYLASVTLWLSALLTNSLLGHSRTCCRGALRMSDNYLASVTHWPSALLTNFLCGYFRSSCRGALRMYPLSPSVRNALDLSPAEKCKIRG